MTKKEWIEKAVVYMISATSEWDVESRCEEYCESLYETYAEEMGDDPFSPECAVDEDMTYWED